MADIDVRMFEDLYEWWNGEKCGNQFIKYVNSYDRELTNATIRKLMFELDKDDKDGELYASFFSAESFLHNMRGYFTEIAGLYMRDTTEDEPIIDIIQKYPSTCGWIILIVSDLDALSDRPEELERMFMLIKAFAVKYATVILIGNGSYEEVFSGCDNALAAIESCLNVRENELFLGMSLYDQEKSPKTESAVSADGNDERDRLNFCWDLVGEQLENNCFDYSGFKELYDETWAYLRPRVSADQVYRRDLSLIKKVSDFKFSESREVYDCKLWELEAAAEFAGGLYYALLNKYGDNDAFSGGELVFGARIVMPKEIYDGFQMDGYDVKSMIVQPLLLSSKMDDLARAMQDSHYDAEGKYLKSIGMTELDEE